MLRKQSTFFMHMFNNTIYWCKYSTDEDVGWTVFWAIWTKVVRHGNIVIITRCASMPWDYQLCLPVIAVISSCQCPCIRYKPLCSGLKLNRSMCQTIRYQMPQIFTLWYVCRLQYAAFYSDCQHEILPVTSGSRISVSYNLYAKNRQFEPLSYPPLIKSIASYIQVSRNNHYFCLMPVCLRQSLLEVKCCPICICTLSEDSVVLVLASLLTHNRDCPVHIPGLFGVGVRVKNISGCVL